MLRAATPVAVLAFATLVLAAVTGPAGCTTKEPQPTSYFDETIGPILQASCVRTNTGVGCHVADGRGNAFGNLDLSSYDGLQKRRDLLLDYGPYLQPSLLLKNVSPYQMAIELWDGTKVTVATDVRHTGGDVLDPTASSYLTLRRWIENGATTNNSGVPPLNYTKTLCSHDVPKAAGFDPSVPPTTSDFPTFVSTAAPALVSCAAGNCHGSHVNALYLTCGGTDAEERWNYFAASSYLGQTGESAELLRRPLATSQGGSYHEGGPIFSSVDDPRYVHLLEWATAHGPVVATGLRKPFLFFAQKVQPILAKKGCMMVQCHSAGMFHDYRLRGGSAGSFSLTTTQKNYDFTVGQMSFESDDVNASRLVRKNLFRPDLCNAPGGIGLTHRGGGLLEDFGAQNPAGTLCKPEAYGGYCDAGMYDYDNGDLDKIPAYCVIREWHKRERADRMPAPLSAIVYVSRPIPQAPDRPQDFDVFAGGASLHVVPASLSATGDLQNLGTDVPVNLAACGLGSSPDVRRPTVSWDGKTIAFAARATPNDALAVYTMNADGTGCAIQPDIAANHPSGSDANGLLVHDFDPVFSPPGPDNVERIVFASTRGNLDSSAFPYSGPQRTPEDPTKPNANLYVLEPDSSGSTTMHVRQLTWQLNMERMPSFMQDGRLIYTAEKREPGFYELALRRQNLDGSDYHPLYSQRATIGFTQATGRGRARAQELRDHLQQRDGAPRSGHPRRVQPVDRRRPDEHQRQGLSGRPQGRGRRSPRSRDRVLPPLARERDSRGRRGGGRRLVHDPLAAAGREDARQLRHGLTGLVRGRLRRLRAGPVERRQDEAAGRCGDGGGRRSGGLRARAQGNLRRHARRAERQHLDPRGDDRGRRDRARHVGARLAALPEHAHGAPGRAGPRVVRRLRGPTAGRVLVRCVRRQHRLRRPMARCT